MYKFTIRIYFAYLKCQTTFEYLAVSSSPSLIVSLPGKLFVFWLNIATYWGILVSLLWLVLMKNFAFLVFPIFRVLRSVTFCIDLHFVGINCQTLTCFMFYICVHMHTSFSNLCYIYVVLYSQVFVDTTCFLSLIHI